MIDQTDLWPVDAEHRYRLYAIQGEHREIIAVSPTMGGIGCAILAIHEDQKEIDRRLADLGRIGILDVLAPGPTGEWILLPYLRGKEVS